MAVLSKNMSLEVSSESVGSACCSNGNW